jgi:hypothetical protein
MKLRWGSARLRHGACALRATLKMACLEMHCACISEAGRSLHRFTLARFGHQLKRKEEAGHTPDEQVMK